MAITRTETQVTWGTGSASSISLSASASSSSNAAAVDQTCFQLKIEIKADNQGTAAAGDTVDFWVLETLGDPDGAGADEYATKEQSTHLATLDTNEDDPAIAVIWLPAPLKGAKVLAINNSAGRAIKASATILEQRG